MRVPTSSLVMALALAMVPLTRGLTITVPPRMEKCIYFKVSAATQKVFGSYQVAAGGFLDIDVKVSGPSDVVGYTAVRKTNDRFAFVAAESGEWKGCFGNTMSTMSSKTVSFSFRVGEGYGDGTDVLATKQEIKPIETHVLKLAEELLSIQETQRYANVRERAHRDSESIMLRCHRLSVHVCARVCFLLILLGFAFCVRLPFFLYIFLCIRTGPPINFMFILTL